MREVILQNMMGRSVLPFPLSLQTKKHTGQCSNKDKAALVWFCCNCFNCLRSVRISDETTFQVVIINIYALKRFFFLKNFRPVPQFVLPITNFEDLSQDVFYPIREKGIISGYLILTKVIATYPQDLRMPKLCQWCQGNQNKSRCQKMWLTETALVRNKSSRLFLGTTSEDVEIVFPKLCTAYQSVLLTDDLWLLGTRQKITKGWHWDQGENKAPYYYGWPFPATYRCRGSV